MDFKIIAAVSLDGKIGGGGRIPWKIRAETQFFRAKTLSGTRNAVIMGRNTWESLPVKPLPSRLNIVLSRTTACDSCVTVDSLEKALQYCRLAAIDAAWVIGGGEVYAEAIGSSNCKELIISRVLRDYPSATVEFPKIPERFVLRRTEEQDNEWLVEYYS